MGAHEMPPLNCYRQSRRSHGSRFDVPQLSRRFSFQGLQEGDEVADLVGIKAELRHGRVPGDDAFRQRFLQCLYGIAFVQGSEGWRDLERAGAYLVDAMTPCAIDQRKAIALL
jgi:hypothetical protein